MLNDDRAYYYCAALTVVSMMEERESCMFDISPIYPKNRLEKEYESYYNDIMVQSKNFSNSQLQEYLYNKVLKGPKEHDEVAFGLLYSILTHPKNCTTIFQTLTIITKDFLGSFVNAAIHLVYEYYNRMTEICREQMFWLLNELLTGNVSNVNNLLIALQKCVKVGDFSSLNIWTTRRLFYVINKHRQYLSNNPTVMLPIIYCYMSSLNGHNLAELTSFIDEEIEFILTMIYNNFNECIRIGKEFIRLLLDLSEYNGFAELWKGIMNDPKFFNSNNQSVIHQIMNSRTSRRIITTQIPYVVEKKLLFITSQVRQYQQHYYSEWLYIQHFKDRENVELIPSLIRFICSVIHPPNEIISSDIVQRWALIGQLLFIARDNERVSKSCNLALFYDWIFFDNQSSTIMNIEPAILLIYNSFESHPLVSTSLVEFICTLTNDYLHDFRDILKKNVNAALQKILEVKVVSSLGPLLEFLTKYPKINDLFQKTFATVIKSNEVTMSNANIISRNTVMDTSIPANNNLSSSSSNNNKPPTNNSQRCNEPRNPNDTNNIENHTNNTTTAVSQLCDSLKNDFGMSDYNPSNENCNHSDNSSVDMDTNRNENWKNIFSGYTYSVAHNHIPDARYDLGNLTEFHEIYDENIKKNLIHIKSSNTITSEIENSITQVLKHANSLEIDSDHFRNVVTCLAYTRMDDLSVSCTVSDIPLLHYIYDQYIKTEDATFIKCMKNIFITWNYVDCRMNYALMYYLISMKSTLELYYNLVDSNEKTIKNDLRVCYEHDVFALEKIIICILHESPKIVINDPSICEILVKIMNPQNCSTILCNLTKHQFNSGLRLDHDTMVVTLIKNSLSWDDFTEEMFYLLLRSFRFQFDMDFLSQYLDEIDHNLNHHLVNYLVNNSPNLKLFTNTFMKNINESYRFIITQWLLKFPSMMVNVISQWLSNNNNQLQSICSLFCYLFEHNVNDTIKTKLKSDPAFIKILQHISVNLCKLTDEKLKLRTQASVEMIDKIEDNNPRKRKLVTGTNPQPNGNGKDIL